MEPNFNPDPNAANQATNEPASVSAAIPPAASPQPAVTQSPTAQDSPPPAATASLPSDAIVPALVNATASVEAMPPAPPAPSQVETSFPAGVMLSPESQIAEVQVAPPVAEPAAGEVQNEVAPGGVPQGTDAQGLGTQSLATPTVPPAEVNPAQPASLPVEIAVPVPALIAPMNAEAIAPAALQVESGPSAPVSATPMASMPVATAPVATTETAPAETATAEVPPTLTPLDVPPPAPAPPKPLVPGAFLRGEFEVKTVLSRGLTNIYQAVGGDYGDTTPELIAEREMPVESQNAPENARTFESALFLPSEDFVQDDRAYRVFDFFESSSLQDFREPTNDERLLSMLHTLAHGLAELEAQNLHADLTTETLRVDGTGALKFLGFVLPRREGEAALTELREMISFLLKHVFAESSTMRLDDRFAGLALSEEVKDLARRIDEDAPQPFASVTEVAAAIDAIYQPHPPIVDAALHSDVGQERELNEDSGMIVRVQRAAHLGTRAMELYIVSDGMGGHEGGEVASDLTLASLQRNLDALQIDWNDNVAIRAALVDVIDAVNAEVVALTETPKYRGTRAKPGATLVFAVRLGARAFVCNVGDSRAFKYNAAGLKRVSKDHSYVQTLVDRGDITDDEAWDHPEGSIITAHIGFPKLKTRDVFLRLFAPGDTLLLVSDGITDMLRDREVEAYLQSAQNESAATICHDLVDAANAAGGFDNITVLCVRFS